MMLLPLAVKKKIIRLKISVYDSCFVQLAYS